MVEDQGAKLSKIAEFLELKNFTDEIDLSERYVKIKDINRPALQLTGYFEHFDSDRIQLVGMVEWTYLQHIESDEARYAMLTKL